MKPTQKAIDIIKSFEGLKLESYKCPAGVWTIGYGSTRWPDGKAVEPRQKVSIDEAEKLLTHEVTKIARRLPEMEVNQNQFDAVVSFAYNVGVAAFANSTLYRLISKNPNNPLIGDELMKWRFARVGGVKKELRGLTRRREAEKLLYFSKL